MPGKVLNSTLWIKLGRTQKANLCAELSASQLCEGVRTTNEPEYVRVHHDKVPSTSSRVLTPEGLVVVCTKAPRQLVLNHTELKRPLDSPQRLSEAGLGEVEGHPDTDLLLAGADPTGTQCLKGVDHHLSVPVADQGDTHKRTPRQAHPHPRTS